MVPVRVIDGVTGGPERFVGPIAFQTLFALSSSARHFTVQLRHRIHERHVPLYCVNRPVPPLLLSFQSPEHLGGTMLIWHLSSFLTKLRCVFFPADQVSGQQIQWPTHELILHLQASGLAPEASIDPSDFDLCDDLQVQLLNAAGRLAGEDQWVEIDETEFRDRSAGQGVPLPPLHLEMLLTAIEDVLIPGGYISLKGTLTPPQVDSIENDTISDDSVRRGPIAQEKVVSEHWVIGPRRPGGEHCGGICQPEYSDPRHGSCTDCGRKTWLRRGSVHKPGGANSKAVSSSHLGQPNLVGPANLA